MIVLGLGAAVCEIELCVPVDTRMIESRSGNAPHGETAETNSELGPTGYWPIAVAAAATAIGLVHQALWVISPGVAAVVLTTSGLLFRQPTSTGMR